MIFSKQKVPNWCSYKFDPNKENAQIIINTIGEILGWAKSTPLFLIENGTSIKIFMTEEEGKQIFTKLQKLGIKCKEFVNLD